MPFTLVKFKNSIRKRLEAFGIIDKQNTPIASSSEQSIRCEYLVLRHKKGVEYLKSKGVNFGSPFTYKQPKKQVLPSGLKVAVCISGYLRTFERTAPSFVKNVLEPLNADLFIYAPNKTGVSWVSAKKKHSSIVSQEDWDSDSLNVKKIEKFYPSNRIKKCVLWDYDESIFFNKYYSQNDNGLSFGRDYRRGLSFLYHVEKCNDLKTQYEQENNFEYDVVIRLRGDLVFFEQFNIERILQDKNFDKTIYYNAFNDINEACQRMIETTFVTPSINVDESLYFANGEHFFNDYITVANSKNMNIFSSLYSNIEKYSQLKLSPCTEAAMFYHAAFNGLNVDMENFTTCILFRENNKSIINQYSFNTEQIYNNLFTSYISNFQSLYAD